MPLLLSLGQAAQAQYNKQFQLLSSSGFYKTNMTFISTTWLRSEDRVAAALARGPEKFTRCLHFFECSVSRFHQFASLVAAVMSTAPPWTISDSFSWCRRNSSVLHAESSFAEDRPDSELDWNSRCFACPWNQSPRCYVFPLCCHRLLLGSHQEWESAQ